MPAEGVVVGAAVGAVVDMARGGGGQWSWVLGIYMPWGVGGVHGYLAGVWAVGAWVGLWLGFRCGWVKRRGGCGCVWKGG
eukprot:3688294-Rhodomonas_salina.1